MRCFIYGNARIAWPAAGAVGLVLLVLTLTGCEQLDALANRRNGKTEKTVKTTVPPEMQSDAHSSLPVISADGRFVAFRSDATNLVIGTTTGAAGIYLKDTQTGRTIRVSSSTDGVQANKDSDSPSISADGRFVAFVSAASNLEPGDNNNQCQLASGISINCPDIFLKDTETGVTTIVSTGSSGEQGNGESSEPSISADGRFVAFSSKASNLVSGDNNGRSDIFVKDTQTGDLQRISADAAGIGGNGDSVQASISADGRFVAFSSGASNLVPDDTNGKPDVFVKDRQSGSITRASTGPAGEAAGDASGYQGLAISADGRFVAFESSAANLVPGDSNAKRDIYVKDTTTGAVVRASLDAAGGEGLEDSYGSVAISADARWVAFRSDAPNLVPGDTNLKADVFVKDMRNGAITRVSTDSAGAQGKGESDSVSISANGRWLVFDSLSPNLIPGDTNNKRDIFVKDMQGGTTTRVSTSTSEVL